MLMVMKRRKLLVSGLLILFAIALLLSGLIIIRNRPKLNTNKQPVDLVAQEIDTHDSILEDFNNGQFEKVVTSAAAYGDNSKYDITLRLGMYVLCMRAAQNIKNQNGNDNCYDAAKKLTSTLNGPDKEIWLGQLERSHSGKANEAENDPRQ